MKKMSGDDEANVIDEKKEEKVAEIAASSIRSGLAELELKTSQVLQRLENVRTEPSTTNDESNPATTMSKLLEDERKPPSEILRSLETLIAFSDSDDDPEFPLPALDDVSHLALISHSIIAYMSHLDRQHLLRVTGHIAGDTTRWLGSLFRFTDGATSYHTDNADATLRIVRLAIVARCPGYLEGGIPALANPCFYISENTTPMRLQYACRQLGIPLEAIRLIPSNSNQGTMDLHMLQKQVQADLNANRTPLLVIADVGASVCGYVDNLTRMKDICKANNIWLHATGHGLASLACTQGTESISTVVDSIVLNLGFWLGVPSLPIVLLHRQMQNSALTAFESDPIVSKRLNSLALWTILQALGRETIAEKIHVAFQTCSILHEFASKCEGIRVVSRAPVGQAVFGLFENFDKPLDLNALLVTAASVVVFQFDGSSSPASTKDQQDLNSTSSSTDATKGASYSKTVEKLTNASYYDRLNSWLGQIIQRDCPNFDFEIIEHGVHGTCIRYCPLELGLGEQPPTVENLENFAQSLESHVDILRATIKHKATFIRLVEKSDVLRIVNLPDWAGMGGVRFVPEGWESLLTDQAKTELNKLNADLVEALKSTDNAFSLGEGTDGLICVRFGMVTHDTDVEELLDLVVSVGKSVQENSRVLDTMSEIVKKGIEAATADLQRESDEKLWQEGILRHVPVVGRMVNWWSPPIKESGIKGRSLNLTQGVVESTENIYKYHMQMTGAPNQLPANKSPPTPMVQTPVGAPTAPPFATLPTSANHSRSVSQSSGASSSAPELVAANPTPIASTSN